MCSFSVVHEIFSQLGERMIILSAGSVEFIALVSIGVWYVVACSCCTSRLGPFNRRSFFLLGMWICKSY